MQKLRKRLYKVLVELESICRPPGIETATENINRATEAEPTTLMNLTDRPLQAKFTRISWTKLDSLLKNFEGEFAASLSNHTDALLSITEKVNLKALKQQVAGLEKEWEVAKFLIDLKHGFLRDQATTNKET